MHCWRMECKSSDPVADLQETGKGVKVLQKLLFTVIALGEP